MTKSARNKVVVRLVSASIFLTPLLAQTEGNRRILLAMAMNAKEMVKYEWKQRITVIRKGNPSEPMIDQIRFDSNGQMQRTTISAPEQKQMGGIRGRIAAGVKENVKDIMTLAGRYNKPQQMAEAVKKAHTSPGADDTTQLEATNLLEPADSMIMRLNSRTHLATHVDIRTNYQGSPMTIAQDYSPLPDGPNVMRNMKVSVPEKSLAINVDSFDFVRQSASGAR